VFNLFVGLPVRPRDQEVSSLPATSQPAPPGASDPPRGRSGAADRRVRLDPLDAKTNATRGKCEFAAETDPAVLKVLLKVNPGLGEGYDWVECACAAGWQVPHFESVG
jgi:hypothetical protein